MSLQLPNPPLGPTQINPASTPRELREAAGAAWQRMTEQNVVTACPPAHAAELEWLVQVSPFIAWVLEQYQQEALTQLFQPVPLQQEQVRQALTACQTEEQAMSCLRQIRHQEMARIAAADLMGQLPLAMVLQQVSDLADSLIQETLDWLYLFYAERWGRARFADGMDMPMLVIGMGKLGGQELNFSSDIDLIFCYPERGETSGGRRALDHEMYFTRIAQALIRLLGQQRPDGQCYRVDMRLRPFGQSGPMVTSISALEDYYQEQGRNWERYAMVKARVVNACPEWSTRLYQLLRPFVYRRYLDYSAIDALRKMKLLINQEARRRGMAGNIKLGLGGIREVEFVAQVFQLIRGGREPELQTRSLLEALSVCEEQQLLGPGAVGELLDAYAWLRKVEHVLQEINDEQTQQLPQDELRQYQVLAATGYPDWDAFTTAVTTRMEQVHEHFLAAIGGREEMETPEDSEFALLWQDLLADETAHEVLQEAGARDPAECWHIIQRLRMDIRKRSTGPRGREMLGRLVPDFIGAALAHPESTRLLERLFTLLRQIASRTTYLELLVENRGAREQLIFLCRSSPWLAQLLSRFPLLLDELIDPSQLYQLPEPGSYRHRVAEYLLRLPEDDDEALMDALRQVKQIFQLKVAAADLSDGVPLMDVSDHLTWLAEAMIEQVVLIAWRQLSDRHGVPPGRSAEDMGFAVIGYGKLGGYELGYGSDLDLVFVCTNDNTGQTDGVRPLPVQQFYLRLAQRVLHLFTTRTMSGVLYEVDMRLRPSGQAGLLVVRLGTYSDYLAEDAWTWELQALVRARVVFGSNALHGEFAAIRRQALSRRRELTSLRQDIRAMRDRMRRHLWQRDKAGYDIKQMPGGLTDIEFITQYLVLAYAGQHPELSGWTDNSRILEVAAEYGLLTEAQAEQLVTVYTRYRTELHRLALAERGSLSEYEFSREREQVQRVWQHLLVDDIGAQAD